MRTSLSHEHTLLLSSLTVTFAMVGVYWYVYTQVVASQTQIGVARAELAQLTADIRAHTSLEAFVERARVDALELRSYVLSKDNPTPFLALLETLGAEAGVDVEVVSLTEDSTSAEPGAAAPSVVKQYVQVVISATGSWDGVYTLVRLFEYMPYVAQIEKVIFEKNTGQLQGAWGTEVHMRVLVQ